MVEISRRGQREVASSAFLSEMKNTRHASCWLCDVDGAGAVEAILCDLRTLVAQIINHPGRPLNSSLLEPGLPC